MTSPCQEAQLFAITHQRGRTLPVSPEGSDPDDSIRRCSPRKGLAIIFGLRLALNHLDHSEYGNIMWKEH
ncbi:MAG: hypothetical protein HOM55_04665 [Proteobacteria bacterium]|nr:hypothetical protein [Pseudomonadota bacterium]